MNDLWANSLIFINRTSELRDLFNTNAKCNKASRSRRDEQLQAYAVPVAAMTYGAGKTALGSNYLSEMRKWAKGDNLDEDQQAALQSLKEQEGYYDQLQALCADDTVSVRINPTFPWTEPSGRSSMIFVSKCLHGLEPNQTRLD